MKPSDDQLADLYREATRPATWPGPDCPSREALERLALRRADALETRRLTDHLVACSGCAGLVRELRRLEGWSERAESMPPAEPLRARRRLAARWPLALAAVLVVGLAMAFLAGPLRQEMSGVGPGSIDGQPPTLRQDPAGGTGASGTTADVIPADGARIGTLEAPFAWPPVSGATSYRLRLADTTGETLWNGPWSADTTVSAPSSVTDTLDDGVYTWAVDVRGGAETDRLGPFVLVLER